MWGDILFDRLQFWLIVAWLVCQVISAIGFAVFIYALLQLR